MEIATFGELSDMYDTLWGLIRKIFPFSGRWLCSDFSFIPPSSSVVTERKEAISHYFFFFFLNDGKGSVSTLMCYKLLKGRQHFNPLPPFYICGEEEKLPYWGGTRSALRWRSGNMRQPRTCSTSGGAAPREHLSVPTPGSLVAS